MACPVSWARSKLLEVVNGPMSSLTATAARIIVEIVVAISLSSGKCDKLITRPIARPACGTRPSPRYFAIVSGYLKILLAVNAARDFANIRAIINPAPATPAIFS